MLKPTLIQNATTLAPLEVGLWSALVAIILIGVCLFRRPKPTEVRMFGPLLRRVNELGRHGIANFVQRRSAVRGHARRIAARRRSLRDEKEFFGHPSCKSAFTLIELMVVIVVIALLAGIVLPGLAQAKRKAARIGCVSRLKNIGLSFRIFAANHTNLLPAQLSTNFSGTKEYVQTGEVIRHFLCISNELSTPLLLACPSDTRKPATNFSVLSNSIVSYFVGVDVDENKPQTPLAGDRNLLVNGVRAAPGVLTLTTNSLVAWDKDIHRECGNILFGDGHVDQVSTTRLIEQVRTMEIPTNRLLIP